jgi:hypothetical protein
MHLRSITAPKDARRWLGTASPAIAPAPLEPSRVSPAGKSGKTAIRRSTTIAGINGIRNKRCQEPLFVRGLGEIRERGLAACETAHRSRRAAETQPRCGFKKSSPRVARGCRCWLIQQCPLGEDRKRESPAEAAVRQSLDLSHLHRPSGPISRLRQTVHRTTMESGRWEHCAQGVHHGVTEDSGRTTKENREREKRGGGTLISTDSR